jgi:hypothetical protein
MIRPTVQRMIDRAITAFANRIADEIERRIASRNGAASAALAEAAQVIREAGKP